MSWFEHGKARIYYEESGSGDPVLVMPGWSQSVDDLSTLTKALATHYRVIAVDPPGAGKSGPQPRDYPATYFADDAHLFTALLKHLGLESTHLLGFSDGGEYALIMASETPAIARSVVTWGSAGVLTDPTGQLRSVLENIIDHTPPPLQQFRDHLIGTYGEANARAMIGSEVAAMGAIIDQHGGDLSLSKATNITCPVLLIVGEHDMFAPPTLVAQLANRIRQAEVAEVKGAGHDVHHTHSDWFMKKVSDWLKAH